MDTNGTASVPTAAESVRALGRNQQFGTILADPPWRFMNRTGKMVPGHKRLLRYETMTNEEIMALPVSGLALSQSHLYLWVPNALVPEGFGGHATMGVHIQDEHRLVQDTKGWRAGWPRRWVLLS